MRGNTGHRGCYEGKYGTQGLLIGGIRDMGAAIKGNTGPGGC